MSKRNKRYKKRYKSKFKLKKIYRQQVLLISLVTIVAVLGVSITYLVKYKRATGNDMNIVKDPITDIKGDDDLENKQEGLNNNNQMPIELPNGATGNSNEQEREEKQEEIKKTVQYVGTNEEGKKYAYDASKIAEKLENYDYSNEGEKIVFLTFDDGSSTTVTPKVLQTLDDYDVKATFFLLGETIEGGGDKAREIVKEIFDKGNAIANHSYSHDYKILYPGRSLNIENFKKDFAKTDEILKDILGDNFSTRVLRCPGGYSSWNNMAPLDEYLSETNKISIDWNALNKDAEGKKKNAEELIENVKLTAEGKEIVVVLMHDTYGKEETAKALPSVIQYFKDNGYTFKTLV